MSEIGGETVTQTECVIVCTTLPANADSGVFGRTLVEERLAACVVTQPGAHSVYRWKNGIEQADEQQVTIKTTEGRLDQLEERITALHPYDVPELVVISVVDGSPAYLNWLRESTSEEP